MRSNPIGNEMSQTKAASKSAEMIPEPIPVAPIDGDAQKLQSRKTLSENEEWLQKNSGKLVSE